MRSTSCVSDLEELEFENVGRQSDCEKKFITLGQLRAVCPSSFKLASAGGGALRYVARSKQRVHRTAGRRWIEIPSLAHSAELYHSRDQSPPDPASSRGGRQHEDAALAANEGRPVPETRRPHIVQALDLFNKGGETDAGEMFAGMEPQSIDAPYIRPRCLQRGTNRSRPKNNTDAYLAASSNRYLVLTGTLAFGQRDITLSTPNEETLPLQLKSIRCST
jgi:hypothetical protein